MIDNQHHVSILKVEIVSDHSLKIDFLLCLILNQAELAVSEFSGNGAGIVAAANTVISTFFLVFVAEWGDKSFFSTIGKF